jgi:cell pole-organizing protein PopZ
MANDRNEPSMEAILSSIKKIIADEDRSRAVNARRSARDSRRSENDEDVLELTETARDDREEELLDVTKAQSLRQSFSVLQTLSEPGVAPQIVRSGETSLEGLTRELMKPMLKEWLDANLPGIVEAMVAREIERITKKG